MYLHRDYFKANVYTIWVHGPLGLPNGRHTSEQGSTIDHPAIRIHFPQAAEARHSGTPIQRAEVMLLLALVLCWSRLAASCPSSGRVICYGTQTLQNEFYLISFPFYGNEPFDLEFEALGSDFDLFYVASFDEIFNPGSRCGSVTEGTSSRLSCQGRASGGLVIFRAARAFTQICSPKWHTDGYPTLDLDETVVEFNTGSRLPDLFPPKSIIGKWVPRAQIATAASLSLSIGTSYSTSSQVTNAQSATNSISRSTSWSASFGYEVGFSDPFGVLSAGFSWNIGVGGENTHSWAREFTSSVSSSSASAYEEVQTWTDNFQEEMIGKYLWQYEIVTTFCNGEVLNSGMPSIALTESREEPPCCFPGYCNDMRHSDAIIAEQASVLTCVTSVP